jgi:uncharacterized membrane-anchored protein YhcB (DUF1043 family)
VTSADYIAIAGIVVTVMIALGTLQWALSERARISRQQMHEKIDSLHVAFDNFRSEVAGDIGEIRGRIVSMEGRSFRVRRGDPDNSDL